MAGLNRRPFARQFRAPFQSVGSKARVVFQDIAVYCRSDANSMGGRIPAIAVLDCVGKQLLD